MSTKKLKSLPKFNWVWTHDNYLSWQNRSKVRYLLLSKLALAYRYAEIPPDSDGIDSPQLYWDNLQFHFEDYLKRGLLWHWDRSSQDLLRERLKSA